MYPIGYQDIIDSIVKYVGDRSLEWVAKHGPKLFQEIRRRARFPWARKHFIPRASLIDRSTEIEAIQAALTDAPRARILYLVGEGGVGKTRLLEEAEKLAQRISLRPGLICSGILDLYHSDLHSSLALQNAIIHEVDKRGKYFREYQMAKARYERDQADRMFPRDLYEELSALEQLFVKEYNVLASEHRPVIVFDTLEKMRRESDLIQRLCRLEGEMAEGYDWLIRNIGQFNNSVILLAGRPDERVDKDLGKLNRTHPGRFEKIELKGLTRQDTHNLLALLLSKAPRWIQELQKDSDRLWGITKGLPVLLSLVVELCCQAHTVNFDLAVHEADNSRLHKQLGSALFHFEEPLGRVFFFLALARKGLTSALLNYLEPEWSLSRCEELLMAARRSTLVKTRPGSEQVFLHDAIYDLFDAYWPAEKSLNLWYERLARYYRERQSTAANRDEWGKATLDLLYYELLCDPEHALRQDYVQWSESLIKGYEIELDILLRDIVLGYFRVPLQSQIDEVKRSEQEAFERENAIRWIKRFIIGSRHIQARTIAETILWYCPAEMADLPCYPVTAQVDFLGDLRDTAEKLFNRADAFFWGQLLTYYGESLVYTSQPVDRASRVINKAIDLSSSITQSHDRYSSWLCNRVLGRAHNTLGYLRRLEGRYSQALKSYRRALEHFESSQVDDEYADTCNNYAYLKCLLGSIQSAKKYAEQALELRLQLKQRYPLALTYNTLGLIYASAGEVEHGFRECYRALNICEELKALRGIGLCCNALGYISRQKGNAWKQKPNSDAGESERAYRSALSYLQRAQDIFSNQVDEPIRLWEAYNEQGSLYYNWGELCHKQGDKEFAKTLFSKALDFQNKALAIASQKGLLLQKADTHDDMGCVYRNLGHFDQARESIEQCLQSVPDDYKVFSNIDAEKNPLRHDAYWLIAGKAYVQLAILALQSGDVLKEGASPNREKLQTVIENLVRAIFCCKQYFATDETLHDRFRALIRPGLFPEGFFGQWKESIVEIARRYGVDYSLFIQLVP